MPPSPEYASAEEHVKSSLNNNRRGILSAIGSTPLVELEEHLDMRGGRLHVKLEAFNPGGGAKDRPATRMLESALADGSIDTNTTVIAST